MNTSTSPHVPPPIRREDFEVGCLKPGSYSIEDISAAILDHLDRDELSPRQLEALRRYKYEGSWSVSRPDNLDDIRKFFEIFDDFYFHGLLRGYCTLELFRDTHERQGLPLRGYCDSIGPGEERDPRYKLERPRPHIGIRVSRHIGLFDRVSNYIDVLLHEMIHAMFFVYSCTCDRGCREKYRFSMGAPWLGHDLSFQAAGHAIEKRGLRCEWLEHYDKYRSDDNWGSQDCMGLIFCLARDIGMASAMQSGANLPNAADLRRLGLDIWEILDDLEIYRNRIHRPRHNLPMKKNRCLKSHWTVDSWEEAQLVKHLKAEKWQHDS